MQAGWTPDRKQLHLKLVIQNGYHINSNNPGGEAALRLYATTLELPPESGAEVEYPPGEELKFSFAEQPIRVYTNEVTLVARLETPPEKGTKLRVALAYQACDNQACLPTVVKQMEVPV